MPIHDMWVNIAIGRARTRIAVWPAREARGLGTGEKKRRGRKRAIDKGNMHPNTQEAAALPQWTWVVNARAELIARGVDAIGLV